jgi:chromosome segregation ATPase
MSIGKELDKELADVRDDVNRRFDQVQNQLDDRFRTIAETLKTELRSIRRIMSTLPTQEDVDAAVAELGTQITALSDRIDALPADVNSISQEQLDALKADSAKLRTLAASPEVPVPVEPPLTDTTGGTDTGTGGTGGADGGTPVEG